MSGYTHISFDGPNRTIRVGAKEWFFEDHRYFGPSIIDRRSWAVLDKQPGEHSPFWRAYELWSKQGKRLNGERCVWDDIPEPEPIVEMRGRKRFIVGWKQAPSRGHYE